MALITKTTELKDFVPVEVEFKPRVYIPIVNHVQEKYLLRILGDELLGDLEDAYQDSLSDPPAELSPEMKSLMNAVRKVIAPLAMVSYLPLANVRISSNGAQKTLSENYEAVDKADLYFAKIEYLQQGYTGIASLYRFLNKKKADYPAWIGSEGQARYNEFLIRSAKEFHYFVNIRESDWIFELITAYMRDMQGQYVVATIGEELFQDFKQKQNDNTLIGPEKDCVNLLKSSIAHYTYSLVLKTPDMLDEINNVTASRAENFNKTRLESDFQRFDQMAREHHQLGEADLAKAVSYLNKNAAYFPIWAEGPNFTDPNGGSASPSSFDNDNSQYTFFAL